MRGGTFSPPERLEMFFQLFLGGITLNNIPSENGSRLSTSSNSAFPPMVIIYSQTQLMPVQNLVHLLESKGDDIESMHKLFESTFPEIVTEFLCSVTLSSRLLQILGPFLVLLLTTLVLIQSTEIDLDILNRFYQSTQLLRRRIPSSMAISALSFSLSISASSSSVNSTRSWTSSPSIDVYSLRSKCCSFSPQCLALF
jgi:hypothetical protein